MRTSKYEKIDQCQKDFDFNDYVYVDNEQSITNPSTEIEIMEKISSQVEIESDNESDEEDVDERPSKFQAMKALSTLKYYFQCDQRDMTVELNKISTLEEAISVEFKQSKITDCFKI